MLIDLLQNGLQGFSDLRMEETIHTTILNRKGKYKDRANNSITLVNAITPLAKNNHDWLGPLTMEKVVVSRFVNSIERRQHEYVNLWEQQL